MSLNLPRVRNYLQNFDLQKLFVEELGWDRHAATVSVTVDGQTYGLRAFAQKRGVHILECPPDASGRIPDYDTRRKIEQQVSRSAYEHLIIFMDGAKTTQVWQWVARQPGQPAGYREHGYTPAAQPGDALIQKLAAITIPLSEEEAIDLTGTIRRLRDAFDRDRVTKRFYDHFQREHAKFLAFIKGITDQGDLEWYASLMLNRLMFVYFIQQKRFLDNNRDYLQDRLRQVQARRGKGKFQTFYRYFLLCLFHEGFARQSRDRQLSPDLADLLGQVPYLNGGLFDVHELETKHPNIDIPDEAFERLFGFFAQYEWHLDTRPLRNDREINPDVLGYIFEQYINRKQMGAYYTKEDITEYISKNTIIPHLFDAARKKCAVAFQPGSAVWRQLADNPDCYLYPAMRRGVIDDAGEVIPLLAEIQKGLTDVGRREGWNRAADPDYALPTETWREHVARRRRCLEVREKLADGQITQINDLITYNLGIRQLAEDTITACEGPELLRAFYQAICGVSVLDPTCGSGAFLFAALNVLKPLYEACLDRMQAFVDDLDRSGQAHSPKKFEDFRRILADVARHPNRDYFILKSIIVHNLYGVDIMEEAVEICKLRLFLKLVAQIDRVQELEPLPDIDFNIRPGNALVGFASLEEVTQTAKDTLGIVQAEVNRIVEEAEVVERAFQAFRDMQTVYGMEAPLFTTAKVELRKRLDSLRGELDRYTAGEYGVAPDKPKDFEKWHSTHLPFHWFAEFYGIMARGGFDVIIGNPPWVEYPKVRREYTVRGYLTEPCGNLHGICTERGLSIRSPHGRMSFIVQLPMVSSSRMVTVRSVLRQSSADLHVMPFDDRPGKLFEGLEHCRSVIWLSLGKGGRVDAAAGLHTTRYQRWPTEVRPFLFQTVEYASPVGGLIFPHQFPKYANQLEAEVFAKVKAAGVGTVGDLVSKRETEAFIFYQEATQYWVKATVGLPYYAKNGKVGAPAHGRYLYFAKLETARAVCALIHSSLFYAYFIAYGDCFHLSDTLVRNFPAFRGLAVDATLARLGAGLMKALKAGAERKTIQTRDGHTIAYDEYYGRKAKETIDEIDRLLAKHYGFTDEELGFVISYDAKYRMGQDDSADDD
jgi:hypothetical protein